MEKENTNIQQRRHCTCNNFECPLHPTKHNKGCTPCIVKNLRLKEMPNCFFNLIENSEDRKGDSFEDFAKLVLAKREEGCDKTINP